MNIWRWAPYARKVAAFKYTIHVLHTCLSVLSSHCTCWDVVLQSFCLQRLVQSSCWWPSLYYIVMYCHRRSTPIVGNGCIRSSGLLQWVGTWTLRRTDVSLVIRHLADRVCICGAVSELALSTVSTAVNRSALAALGHPRATASRCRKPVRPGWPPPPPPDTDQPGCQLSSESEPAQSRFTWTHDYFESPPPPLPRLEPGPDESD